MYKTVKSLFMLTIVALCVGIPFLAHAGIGAELSNQPPATEYSAVAPLTSVPSAPQVIPGMGTDLYSQPAKTDMLMAQQPSGYDPYMSGYGNIPGMPPSQPYMGPVMSDMMSPYQQYQQYQPYQQQQYQPYQQQQYQPYQQQQYQQYQPYQPYQPYQQPSYPSYVPMPSGTAPGYIDPYQGGYPPVPSQVVPYPQQPQPQYGSADQVYNQAMQAYRSRDYWTAMTKFREVATMYPQSDLADNAHYWMGEIYYAWKNYPAAIQSFQTVMQLYPQGNKVPDAMLKMGYAYAEIRQYGVAKSILNDVAMRFSDNSRIRNLAVKKLNALSNVY